jgi:hypothetical protein
VWLVGLPRDVCWDNSWRIFSNLKVPHERKSQCEEVAREPYKAYPPQFAQGRRADLAGSGNARFLDSGQLLIKMPSGAPCISRGDRATARGAIRAFSGPDQRARSR